MYKRQEKNSGIWGEKSKVKAVWNQRGKSEYSSNSLKKEKHRYCDSISKAVPRGITYALYDYGPSSFTEKSKGRSEPFHSSFLSCLPFPFLCGKLKATSTCVLTYWKWYQHYLHTFWFLTLRITPEEKWTIFIVTTLTCYNIQKEDFCSQNTCPLFLHNITYNFKHT